MAYQNQLIDSILSLILLRTYCVLTKIPLSVQPFSRQKASYNEVPNLTIHLAGDVTKHGRYMMSGILERVLKERGGSGRIDRKTDRCRCRCRCSGGFDAFRVSQAKNRLTFSMEINFDDIAMSMISISIYVRISSHLLYSFSLHLLYSFSLHLLYSFSLHLLVRLIIYLGNR